MTQPITKSPQFNPPKDFSIITNVDLSPRDKFFNFPKIKNPDPYNSHNFLPRIKPNTELNKTNFSKPEALAQPILQFQFNDHSIDFDLFTISDNKFMLDDSSS